jgi:hypothetical protein
MLRRPYYLFHYILLCLCSVFLLSLAFSANAFAAQRPFALSSLTSLHSGQEFTGNVNHARSSSNDPIVVTWETYTIHFPNYIDFTMTASDLQSVINQATIAITFNDATNSQDTKLRNINISSPAKVITLHWRENTNGANFHHPGTTVQYYWALQDRANHQHIDKTVTFTTIDTRFAWQHLSQGLLRVYWYNRSLDFGQTLLDKARASISHISQTLGAGLLHPISLWVYASNDDFHGALTPGAYEWIGGQAYPYLNEAFISAVDDQDDTLVRDMPHELTHLALHQLVAKGIGEMIPSWFDEGLAVYNQFYHEPELKFRLNQALTTHSLLRLYDLVDGFPSNGDTAYLAYAQSWNLLDYMYHTFGNAKMALLIQKMNNAQADFNDDLTQALGEDQLHLENQWRLNLGQPAVITPDQVTPTPQASTHTPLPQTMPTDNTAPVLIGLGSALIVLPIVGLAALLIYQRRKYQRELAMQNAQQMLAASFSLPQRPGTPNTPGPLFPTESPYIPSRGQYMPFAYGSENPYENGAAEAAPRAMQQGANQIHTSTTDTPWQFEYPTYNEHSPLNEGTVQELRRDGNGLVRKNVPQE